jgi:ElaB/YqjD/DUF883 family membrane-anchored ribosome-binding protein/uncharacterized protein YjbJ (UPF0337 family)
VAEERKVNASNSETDEIQREIERTRVEMSETIGEIQDRLRPDHLLQQAKDGMRDAATGKVKDIMHTASETAQDAAVRARGYGNHLAWYAKEHPIRIAITAGVITWWMLRDRSSSDQWYGVADTVWEDDELGMTEGSMGSRARNTASSVSETAAEYAARTKETVGEVAASAASTARSASRRVATAASSATRTTNDWAHQNPLAAGALAVAAGMAVGLAVRSTQYEDRTLGTARDQAVQKAKTVADNLRQNVTDKVTTYAENVVGESIEKAAAEPPMGRA